MPTENNNISPNLKGPLVYSSLKFLFMSISFPIDLVRSNIYLNRSGIWNNIKSIYTHGGIRAFYNGFPISISRACGRDMYRGWGFENLGHNNMAIIFNALCDTIVMPLDKVMAIQQTSQKALPRTIKEIFSEGCLGALRKSYNSSGFYLTRQLAAYKLSVESQRAMENILESRYSDKNNIPFHQYLLASALTGCLTAFIINPFNRIITNLQVSTDHKTWVEATKEIVKTDGISLKSVTRGTGVGILLTAISQTHYGAAKYLCSTERTNHLFRPSPTEMVID